MEVKSEALRERYLSMDEHRLIELAAMLDLTEGARIITDEVVALRGIAVSRVMARKERVARVQAQQQQPSLLAVEQGRASLNKVGGLLVLGVTLTVLMGLLQEAGSATAQLAFVLLVPFAWRVLLPFSSCSFNC